MDGIGANIVKIKNLSGRRHIGYNSQTNSPLRNRISPTNEDEDTVVDFEERPKKEKRKGWRGKKALRSNSSNGNHRSNQKFLPRRNFYRIIAQRDCCKFVSEKKVNPKQERSDKCCCGLLQNQHGKNTIQDVTATEWKPETCTLPRRTTCYGELEFTSDTSNNKARKHYVRCAHDTDVQVLLDMMKTDWKLKVPNLLISVTGGALSFYLKPNLKKAFTKGLLKVATSTSAWIITAGTNAGVMEHVGDAFSKHGGVGNAESEISLLGFAPWSAIDGKETLKNPNLGMRHSPPVQYSFAESKTGLDKNHTHFILVDNGTTGKFGTEIELRSRFEAIIAKQCTESSSSTGKVYVPVVILCLEGGPNTIKTIAEAIKNNTPAVVIGGSGRAADVITYAYNHLESDDLGVSYIMNDYVDSVKDEIRRLLRPKEEKQVEDIFQSVKDILKDITMVTVFVLDDESGNSDIDLAILQALLKANNISRKVKDDIRTLQKSQTKCFATQLLQLAYDCSEQASRGFVIKKTMTSLIEEKVGELFGMDISQDVYKKLVELLQDEDKVIRFLSGGKLAIYELTILTHLLKDTYEVAATKTSFQMQLKLALAWNRIDVAKSEIFSSDLKTRLFQSEWLFDSMLAAILDDKFDFVNLFLREGLNLKSFLTLENLLTLYKEINPTSPFGTAITALNKWKQWEVEQRLRYITMSDVARVMEELMGDRFTSRYNFEPYSDATFDKKASIFHKEDSGTHNTNKHTLLPEPDIDLFTWTVFANRRELAKLIWDNIDDSVACALIASKLLKKLAEKVADDKTVADTVDDLLDHSNVYETHAVGVLDECRKHNDEFAQNLVVKEQENFGGLTSLDIAVSADNQEFIAHPSCQTLLSRLWMGALDINTSFWQVLPCIFFPIMIRFVCVFNEEDDSRKFRDVQDGDQTFENEHFDDNDDMSFNMSLQGSRVSFLALKENTDMDKNGNVESKFLEDSHSFQQIADHFDDINNESGEAAFQEIAQRGYLDRIFHFYKAPFVKFITNVISYTCFLALYSFIICTRFELAIHPAEYVLHGWVLTLIFEEIRQLLHKEPENFFKKLEFYVADMWNIVDSVSLLAFVVATILRYLANKNNDKNLIIASRIIFATDVVLFFLRLLQIFLVNRKMGPKVVMIRKMLDDLLYFVVILIVFILAYGVAMQAVLYPNTTDVWEAVVNVWNRPYWQMYGELFYEDIYEPIRNHTTGGLLCEQENPDDPCPDDYGRMVVPVYMAVYMLFTNILLLNLLIAIFNNTYEKVQENSDRVWKFQRYDVISEYNDRPAFCPPFIIFTHIYGLIFYIYRRLCKRNTKNRYKGSSLKKKLTTDESKLLRKWERGILEIYVYSIEKRHADTQDTRVKTILNRITTLTENFDNLNGGFTVNQNALRPETRQGSRNPMPSIETRIVGLERNIEHILQLLTQMNQRQGMLVDGIVDVSNKRLTRTVTFASDEDAQSNVTSIHTKSRLPIYPGNSIVKRFKVPDDKVSWNIDFPEYDPIEYTASFVLDQPYWADNDLMTLSINERPKLPFNEYDETFKVNRKSHMGSYQVVDRLPRNPYGRTGVIGRGNLGRFGPNHAADPIATRWRRTSSGIEMDHGKRILEFIAIQRKDNQQWAIPGGMVEPGENISETLRKEFTEEALAKLEMDRERRDQLSERINFLFSNGVEVYKGYVDDPRNTDNAWMETVACNFHDDTGEVFGEFQLKAGDDAQAVRWQRVSGRIPLFASHVGILEQVAKMHNAAF